MIFENDQKILFIGDSITDCNRRGSAAPYGDGYVGMLYRLVTARYPDLQLTFVNKGIDGNTVRSLAHRWEQDVIAEQPHWLSIMIGGNDARRHIDRPALAVPLPEYEATLRQLLEWTCEATRSRLILAEPYVIESDPEHPLRKLMDAYRASVHELSREFGALLVPVQHDFDEALRHSPPRFWSFDRVHPQAHGHALIALSFLRICGFAL